MKQHTIACVTQAHARISKDVGEDDSPFFSINYFMSRLYPPIWNEFCHTYCNCGATNPLVEGDDMNEFHFISKCVLSEEMKAYTEVISTLQRLDRDSPTLVLTLHTKEALRLLRKYIKSMYIKSISNHTQDCESCVESSDSSCSDCHHKE